MAKPPADCAIATCERKLVPPYGRGMCSLHYQRWRKYGDPEHVRVVRYRIAPCAVDGCDKPMIARDWCSAHWTRWHRHGSPDARLRGEVLNGCRVCPACDQDVPISQYTEGLMSPCRACLARRAGTRRTFIPWEPKRYLECACRACDAVFMGNAKQDTYCSQECAAAFKNKANWKYMAARRNRLRVALVEPYRRHDIFKRDGWTCAICREAINPALPWPDPMCAVVDHIVPLALGGAHSPSNAQATHNLCNAIKGIRPMEEVARG